MSCAVSITISCICCQCSFTSLYFLSASSTLSLIMLLYSSCLFLVELPYMHSWLELPTSSFCCIKQTDMFPYVCKYFAADTVVETGKDL